MTSRVDVEDRVVRALRSGPLYRPTLELVVGRGDLSRELRALARAGRVEVAAEHGPQTYRLHRREEV